jgi:hypothetical protein
MSKGLVFWRRDEDGENRHLRFVISDPDVDGKVLIVHMTSYHDNGREDTSCILNPGDHECIRSKSFIRYDRAFEIEMITLLIEKTNGSITMEPDLNGSILKRIQDGARGSASLRRKFRKYFDKF